MDSHETEARRLRQDAEWALRSALDPGDVLPLLHRLARTAAPASEEATYAHRQLAELLVERHPWRAALHARKVLAWSPDDDRAWAVLGLCQTLLGHYRYAATAYQRALNAAPKNPWYAHNLGHLVDVALGRPADALTWLRAAYDGAPTNREITASFAHALARAGRIDEARDVLSRSMKRGVSREHAALWAWIEAGAPADRDSGHLDRRGGPIGPRVTIAPSTEPPKRRRRIPPGKKPAAELESVLARGLDNLPLQPRQRARARTLARDPVARALAEDGHSIESLAAAIAYAIVFIDQVPLTQAEVAATFRVSGSSLRGRFNALRSHLPIAPTDARSRRR